MKSKQGKTNVLLILGIFVIGLLLYNSGFFAKLGTQSVTGGTGSTTNIVTTTSSSPGTAPDSLLLLSTEEYSATRNVAGNFDVYTAGTDAKDPSAQVLATITTAGTAYTGGQIICGEKYTVVYSNSTTRYGEYVGSPAGIVLVPCSKVNPYTGDVAIDVTADFGFKPHKVATLDDIMDETSTSGIINGRTSNVSNSAGNIEIGNNQSTPVADGMLVYDESVGDGQFYVQPTFSASGANAELLNPVITFWFDSTSPPEGNEITAMTVSLISGTDMQIPSTVNWVQVWANQEQVKLKNPIKSGEAGTYRFTITYNEANTDNNADKWELRFDDLNSVAGTLGKDAKLNLGATYDRIRFDSQA